VNIGRAEIGIILLANNLPYIGWLYYLLWIIFPSVDLKKAYSFYFVVTSIGLILFTSDRKGFLRRMKGNKLVSALLAICGLILTGAGLLLAYANFVAWNFTNTEIPGHPLTLQESTIFLVTWAWAGLELISGILWTVYGFKMWRYKDDFQSSEQENRQQKNWMSIR
jgi:hypothetical protein